MKCPLCSMPSYFVCMLFFFKIEGGQIGPTPKLFILAHMAKASPITWLISSFVVKKNFF